MSATPCQCEWCREGREHSLLIWQAIGACGLGVVLALMALFVVFTFGCGPVHHPPPPQTPRWTLTVQTEGGAAVRILDGPNALTRGQADASGLVVLADLQQSGFTICAAAVGFRENCAGVTLTSSQSIRLPLARNMPTAPVLHPDGKIFRTEDGRAWRWKGVSAFKLMDRFTKGENIDPFLDAYKGFNVLRVWAYVKGEAWKGRDWPNPPTVEQAKAFLAYVGQRGWTVELTLLTDDEPARLAWAKGFVPQLAAEPKPTNVVLEIGNEPTTHKQIDTKALKATLDASGFVYASGNYEESASAFGSYLVHHSARDSEWPRKAHDCLDFWSGGGPHKPTDPPHHVPCVLDEPAKPQDVTPNADDWRAYFGAASLMSSGATWHCETCKFGDPPTAQEAALAAAALEGLNAFPADAPLGPYSRPSEQSLRTYVIGPFMVRVRPQTASVAGWARIGDSNVLWKR